MGTRGVRWGFHLNAGGCWEWGGNITRAGYGQTGNNDKKIDVHRASYETFVGEIPKGMCVLHRCDNRKCGNPDHLFLGSKGDNARDRNEKGRTAKGSKMPHAKLTPDNVLEIRRRRAEGETYKSLARSFGVAQNAITQVVQGKSWKHVMCVLSNNQ